MLGNGPFQPIISIFSSYSLNFDVEAECLGKAIKAYHLVGRNCKMKYLSNAHLDES